MAKSQTKNLRKSSKTSSVRSKTLPKKSGVAGTFNDTTEAVTTASGRVPSSAIYWGLGALALGAAAAGAYMYRERIMELYGQAKETLEDQFSEMTSSQADSTRASNSDSAQSEMDSH